MQHKQDDRIVKQTLELLNPYVGPPPPPPQIFNCGELRERHHGRLVEIEGKVNRSKGRFLELKDQHGCIQCVSPPGVSLTYRHCLCCKLLPFVSN